MSDTDSLRDTLGLVHTHALRHLPRLTAERQLIDVESLSQQRALTRKEQVTRCRVHSGRIGIGQQTSWLCRTIEIGDVDTAKIGIAGGKEQEVSPVRKKLRRDMTDARSFDSRDLRHRASALRHAVERPSSGREEYDAIPAPRAACAQRCVRQRLHGTALKIDALELALCEDTQRPAVWGPEHAILGVVGSLERPRGATIQRMDPDIGPAIRPGHERDPLSVGRDGEREDVEVGGHGDIESDLRLARRLANDASECERGHESQQQHTRRPRQTLPSKRSRRGWTLLRSQPGIIDLDAEAGCIREPCLAVLVQATPQQTVNGRGRIRR